MINWQLGSEQTYYRLAALQPPGPFSPWRPGSAVRAQPLDRQELGLGWEGVRVGKKLGVRSRKYGFRQEGSKIRTGKNHC